MTSCCEGNDRQSSPVVWCLVAMSSKTILEKGSGLFTPNELSTAVLNVVGRLVASDGTETVFEQQQRVKHTLGIKLTIDVHIV